MAVLPKVLMKDDDSLGRTRDVGQPLHSRIQESGGVATDQKVSPDKSPTHHHPRLKQTQEIICDTAQCYGTLNKKVPVLLCNTPIAVLILHP